MVLSNVHEPLRALSSLYMNVNHEKANIQQNIYSIPTYYFVLLH